MRSYKAYILAEWLLLCTRLRAHLKQHTNDRGICSVSPPNDFTVGALDLCYQSFPGAKLKAK